MIPAAPIQIECPHCQQQALKESLVSGNTLGSVSWTDGKREAPMLPEFPILTFCDRCKQPKKPPLPTSFPGPSLK